MRKCYSPNSVTMLKERDVVIMNAKLQTLDGRIRLKPTGHFCSRARSHRQFSVGPCTLLYISDLSSRDCGRNVLTVNSPWGTQLLAHIAVNARLHGLYVARNVRLGKGAELSEVVGRSAVSCTACHECAVCYSQTYLLVRSISFRITVVEGWIVPRRMWGP
jgi:hypothetical protein